MSPIRRWQREMDLGIENDLTQQAKAAKGRQQLAQTTLRCLDCHDPIVSGEFCDECAKDRTPAPLRSTIDIDQFVRATLDGAIGDETITDRAGALAACEYGFARKVGRPLLTQERTRIALRVTLELNARDEAKETKQPATSASEPAPVMLAFSPEFYEQFTKWYCGDVGATFSPMGSDLGARR